MKRKICRECGSNKKLSDFHGHPGMKDGHLNYCKKCRNKENSEYQQTKKGKEAHGKACRKYGKTEKGEVVRTRYLNSEKGKRLLARNAKIKKSDLQQYKDCIKHNYGITIEQYNQMFVEQKGVCFLCKKPELDRRLGVDHNHDTGEIRSLLCRQCNFLVGHIENNVSMVKQILKYI